MKSRVKAMGPGAKPSDIESAGYSFKNLMKQYDHVPDRQMAGYGMMMFQGDRVTDSRYEVSLEASLL